jgi:hypothetical protein
MITRVYLSTKIKGAVQAEPPLKDVASQIAVVFPGTDNSYLRLLRPAE